MTQLMHLFEPIKIGAVEVKNRLMMLALTAFYGNQARLFSGIKISIWDEVRVG